MRTFKIAMVAWHSLEVKKVGEIKNVKFDILRGNFSLASQSNFF